MSPSIVCILEPHPTSLDMKKLKEDCPEFLDTYLNQSVIIDISNCPYVCNKLGVMNDFQSKSILSSYCSSSH